MELEVKKHLVFALPKRINNFKLYIILRAFLIYSCRSFFSLKLWELYDISVAALQTSVCLYFSPKISDFVRLNGDPSSSTSKQSGRTQHTCCMSWNVFNLAFTDNQTRLGTCTCYHTMIKEYVLPIWPTDWTDSKQQLFLSTQDSSSLMFLLPMLSSHRIVITFFSNYID